MHPADLERLVTAAMPGARVSVADMTGTSDHFAVLVVSDAFEGKSLVQRHKILHGIFEPYLSGPIHAVKYRTLTPDEAARQTAN